MAIRLTGDFYDIHSTHYRVDIYDGDFSGSPSEIEIKNVDIDYDSGSGSDPSAPIVGSRAEVGIAVHYEDTVVPEFIEDFAGGAENRFFIRITKVLTSLMVWGGAMTPDFAGEDDTAPLYTFKVSAICGLATLKKVPYHDGTAIYTGLVRIISHLTNSLSKIAITNLFWGPTDIFLKTAIDSWEESMPDPPGADDDPLYKGAVDHSAFYDFKTQGNVDKDVLSCYDVLSHVLRSFNARIMQVEGVWWVEQIPYRSDSPYYTRHYDKTGIFLSSATNSGANIIDQTSDGAKLATMNYDFLPALSKAEVTYEVRMRRNFLAGVNATNQNFDQEISDNGGTATARLRFTINYDIKDNGFGAPAGVGYFIIPKVILNIGTSNLKRTYYIQNWSSYLNPLEWGSPGDGLYVPINVGQIPPGIGVQGSVLVDLLLPPLPAPGSSNSFHTATYSCDMAKWDGTAISSTWFTKEIYVTEPYLEMYDQGTPFVNEDEVLYVATNPSSATSVFETSVRIGSAELPNSVGRVKVYDGAEWVNGYNWGQGTGTRDKALGDLLALNLLNARLTPIRILNGNMLGDFRMHRLMQTLDGKKWMMMRTSWSLGENTISGSWFELNYGVDGVSSTPIKIKVNPGGSHPTVDPSPTNGGIINVSDGFTSNPPPTVLQPVAYNSISAMITAGSVITSIPVTTPSDGNEFAVGDGVTIVNPINGLFQTFVIATAPALGDTTLSVDSDTALYDFYENSFLVVKQRPYAFSLPEATQGQILRFNSVSGVWEAYSGTTDGHVLTWDITNGWQEQAAAGGSVSDGDYGDVTVTGSGATWTIDNDVVTFAKLQNINEQTLIGRDSPGGGAGNAQEIGLAASLEFDTGGNIQRAALIGDVTAPANSNVLTIADNVVDNFKLANMAANTIKGNNTPGVADPADLTVAQVQTLLGFLNAVGAGLTSPRIPFANDANTLQDEANLRWLTATQEVIIGGDVSLDARFSHNSTANITGSSTLMAGDNNVSGDYMVLLKNTRNVSNTGRSFYIAEVGGTSAGDAFYVARIAGGQNWSFGIDNSDGDKFKITSSTAPGNVANSGLIITTAAAALVGINKDAPAHPLDVSGRARATEFINDSAAGQKPTVDTLGTGLGTAPAINDVSGSNNGFSITFTTGTAPAAGGEMFKVTFATAYPAMSFPVFCQGNDNAANELSKFSWSARGAAGFNLKVRAGQTLTASTQYVLLFTVFGI